MKRLLLIGLATLTLSFTGSEIRQASYYHSKYQGRMTASGQRFDQNKLTAASNRHKLGTKVRVTNVENGKAVDVVVNDRLHKKFSHRIDLSKAAFKELAPLSQGILKVRVTQL